ncbi:acetylglutamate kinase [Clostridia bacterium]|nr:acetylglutamate kinase [Clostridia bacterium]
MKINDTGWETPDHRAMVLHEALPYLQKYSGKIVVVKYGGNAMTNEQLKDAVMSDIVLLSLCGIRIVLVHGGGPEINAMLKKTGKESRFVNGLRHTDDETMDIVQMVLCGKVNKDLVDLLHRHGGRAIGLCGLDGHMIQAVKERDDLGLVGHITRINTEIIDKALDAGYIPVISTVAAAYLKDDEHVYNINADTAAARIGAEMKAQSLILMTDIRGLLRDKDDEDSLIYSVNVSEVPDLKAQGIISGGMIPKIECCVEAVRRGVPQANIIDGRIAHSILLELLTDVGSGTMIV